MQNISGLIGHYSSSIKHEVACFSNSDPSSMQSEILSHSAPTTPYLHSIEAQTQSTSPYSHNSHTLVMSVGSMPVLSSPHRKCDCLFPSKLEQVVFSVLAEVTKQFFFTITGIMQPLDNVCYCFLPFLWRQGKLGKQV
jgi:hypothetical protein